MELGLRPGPGRARALGEGSGGRVLEEAVATRLCGERLQPPAECLATRLAGGSVRRDLVAWLGARISSRHSQNTCSSFGVSRIGRRRASVCAQPQHVPRSGSTPTPSSGTHARPAMPASRSPGLSLRPGDAPGLRLSTTSPVTWK